MPSTQFPANLKVADLDGRIGFAITGFPATSSGGVYSFSSTGDINVDGIDDFVIGIPNASGSTGQVYVLFGERDVINLNSLTLTSLMSGKGFNITGFGSKSLAGKSVSGAGDINADGIADLVIGAPYANNYAGAGFVIFGKSGIGSSGILSVASLNGANGFTITGLSSYGGASVSSTCDINDDGVADIVVGTSGSNVIAYVIFGKSGMGSSGSQSVASLTGANGFVISGTFTGIPFVTPIVHCAGDINHDGIDDLVIGVPEASSSSGECYVIFGKSGIGSSGSLNVASLSGSTGFIITGFPVNSNGGFSVSSISDINNDGITDLVIGAPAISSFPTLNGWCYVVFGNVGIGISGTLNVKNLMATIGFNITGFPIAGGNAVSGVGDVNGDGIGDVVIGAPYVTGGTSYVVFGRNGIGNSGTLSVTSLNGSNGFSITGFPSYSYSGSSASMVGDINADGVTDVVIGAPGAGKIYVIFGDSITNLLANSMTIQKGHTITMDSANFNATYISNLKNNNPNITISFSLSNVQHGYFQSINSPATPITYFTQREIDRYQIQFVHDDSIFAPSYYVTSGDGGLATMLPQPAIVTFIHLGAKLIHNTLAINLNQTLIITSSQLSAIDLDTTSDNPNLIFIVSNVQHGQFELVINPGIAITSFTQSQIQASNIQFVQDGSKYSPSYSIQVSDGAGGVTTTAQAASIAFNLPPVLINNNLSINQGQAVILDSMYLSAIDPDDPTSSLIFIASQVQHGYFELIKNPGTVIESFIQAQVQNGDVEFIPDGSSKVPSINMAVSDGKVTTLPRACVISFNLAPQLMSNILNIKQGETVILTSTDLSASDPDDLAGSLLFIISQVKHGNFELVTNPRSAILNFTQGQIAANTIQFVQDGSGNAPSYNVAVSDGKMTIAAQSSLVSFDAAPILLSNQLSLTQGQTVTIIPSDLSASDDQTPASDLEFIASDVAHGYFEDASNPGILLTQFPQQKIFDGTLKFVADGSSLAPTYNISVTDGSLTTNPSPAVINFSLSTLITAASDITLRNAIIGGTISGVIGLMFLIAKLAINYKANRYLKKALTEQGSTEEKLQTKFYRKVIFPITMKIFDRVKTTGFLGYRSEKDTKAYIGAIEQIVSHLIDYGVDLNIEKLSPQKQTRLFNEISRQVRLIVVPKYGYCSEAYLVSFFKPDVTPKQIEDHAEDIAWAVSTALGTRFLDSSTSQGSNSSIELQEIQALDSKTSSQDLESEIQNLEQSYEAITQRIEIATKQLEQISPNFAPATAHPHLV